ncbi:MAG: lysylphosphatidylglycerol synthase transmembrane domain-containing protein [Candidatus Hodarchaeota archaeon]
MKKFILGMLVSLVAIYFTFKKVDWRHLIEAFKSANYFFIIPSIALVLFSVWVRAVRWRYFLNPIKENTALKNIFSATIIGYMANHIFPLRLGELFRAYTIGKSENISKSSALATIMVERIIDIFSLLLILSLIPFFYIFPDKNIKYFGYIILVATVFLLLFLIFLMEKRNFVLLIVRFCFKPFPERWYKKVQQILTSFIQGLVILKRSEHYFSITWLTSVIWGMYVVIVYSLFRSFNFIEQYQLSIVTCMIILVMTGIGITIPSSPGYIGTFHLLCIQGLAFFSIPKNEALGYAIVLHGCWYIPPTLLGLIYFWKENLRFSEVKVIRKTSN